MVYNHIRGVGTYGPLRGAHKDVGRGAFLPLNVKSGEVTSPIIGAKVTTLMLGKTE